jgi:gas vesicle protein
MRRLKRESTSSEFNPAIIGGILTGTIIVAAAALFLNSKRGRQLKDELGEFCQDAKEKIHDFSDQIIEKSDHLFHNSKQNDSQNRINWIIGGVAGGIIGISAAVLYTTDSGSRMREHVAHVIDYLPNRAQELREDVEEKACELIESFEDKIANWVKIAQNVIEMATNNVEECVKPKKNQKHSSKSFLDLASLGIRLLQSLKK